MKRLSISADTKAISRTAIEGAKKIKKEKRLNKRRVASYGDKVENDEQK
jgi:hypothetical protein